MRLMQSSEPPLGRHLCHRPGFPCLRCQPCRFFGCPQLVPAFSVPWLSPFPPPPGCGRRCVPVSFSIRIFRVCLNSSPSHANAGPARYAWRTSHWRRPPPLPGSVSGAGAWLFIITARCPKARRWSTSAASPNPVKLTVSGVMVRPLKALPMPVLIIRDCPEEVRPRVGAAVILKRLDQPCVSASKCPPVAWLTRGPRL